VCCSEILKKNGIGNGGIRNAIKTFVGLIGHKGLRSLFSHRNLRTRRRIAFIKIDEKPL
jgi:hypothetical protein